MRTILATLVILIAALAGVAFYRGWLVVGTRHADQPGRETVGVNVDLDETKLKEDMKTLRRKASEVGDSIHKGAAQVQRKAEQSTGLTTLEGPIVAVDAQKKELTMTVAGQPRTVRVGGSTVILRGDDRVDLEALRPGDQVTVKVTAEDGQSMARSVLVQPKA